MASHSRSLYSYSHESVIRGHHVYKAIWTPVVGEILNLQQEIGNSHDLFATTVKKGATIVGRVPREHSKIYWNFLEQGGRITCEVTGRRQLGKGLEVPCVYRFEAEDKKLTNKLKKVFGSIEGRFTHSCPLLTGFFVLVHVIVFQYVLILFDCAHAQIVQCCMCMTSYSVIRTIHLSGIISLTLGTMVSG